MPKPESNALTLLAILIAGALIGRFWAGPSAALAGIVLLVILFSYDAEKERTPWQSLGFAAVAGFCLIPVCQVAFGYVGLEIAIRWPAVNWIEGIIVFLVIDRVRMNRAPAPVYETRMAPPAPVQPVSEVATAPESKIAPEAPTLAAPPPNAIAVPIGAGKPATIYLNLVGEGLVCLRPVQSEHMGKDYYRIVETVPEGETWEFQPGQIVRCQKKNLSSGKALVAIEEAPRAR